MLKSTKKEKDPCQGQIFCVLRHRKKIVFTFRSFPPKKHAGSFLFQIGYLFVIFCPMKWAHLS